MASIPWFPIYASDLLIDDDLFNLDPKAEGLLLRMWCLCWVDGYAPSDPDLLSLKVRRIRPYVQMYLPMVLHFFQKDENGNLHSRRIEEERAKAMAKSEKCKKAINLRWERKRSQHTDEHTDVYTDGDTESILSPSPSPNALPRKEPQSMNGNGRDWTADLEGR